MMSIATPANEKLLSDIRSLSSGTLANLSGLRDYASIERLQAALMSFAVNALTAGCVPLESWPDVFHGLVRHEASRALTGRSGVIDFGRLPGGVRFRASLAPTLPGEHPGAQRFLADAPDPSPTIGHSSPESAWSHPDQSTNAVRRPVLGGLAESPTR